MSLIAIPELPPLSRAALLLDLDGTLLDFAASPMEVDVPVALQNALRLLRVQLGGALAVITGRPIGQVDALLGDIPTAVAGEHGAALRHDPAGEIIRPTLPQPPPAWLHAAAALVAAHPGAMLEEKTHGFVLHFRGAPDAGPALRSGLEHILRDGGAAGTVFQIMAAKMGWEIKPLGADKGTALQAIMRHAPFLGRSPVFVGDDVTDQDAIRAANAAGGVGMLVADYFGEPEAVRQWLYALAQSAAA